jgi:Putative auto-transporter adhesin, head GIN domain
LGVGAPGTVANEVVVMQAKFDDRGRRWTAWAARAVAIMAASGLLAGCMGTSTNNDGSNGGVSISGTSGGRSYSFSNGADGSNGDDGASGGSYAYAESSPGGYAYSYSGPDGLTGSGKLTSRTIDLSGVTSVVAGADFLVHVKTGAPAQAKVTMDDNLVDRIEAAVSGHELRLGLKPGSNVRNATLRAEVTVSRLERLAANGASHATLDSTVTGPALRLVAEGAGQIIGPVQVDRLEASESGASVLNLSGRAGSLHLESVGTSQLHGSELAVDDLDAALSGVSQATVTVNKTLAVTADGVSVLRYRGNPSITRQETSGVSSIVADSS